MPPITLHPLKLGPAGAHYLVDHNGKPFFWSGDTAWSLLVQLSASDATQYLDDRQLKGFNIVLANLIDHKFATNAPANFNRDPPFTGRPFATPNPAYFAHVDQVLRAAGSRNIAVLLDALYLGAGCGDEGWCAEVRNATAAEMRGWGRILGTRYASFNNIVWMIGGDTDPTSVADKVREVVAGIQEFDTRHLITAHSHDESFASTYWPNESWLTIDSYYTRIASPYERAKQLYERTPVRPFFLVESDYENEHGSTPPRLRAQGYWAVLSGGMGHFFGNCPIWAFDAAPTFCTPVGWKAQLNSAPSSSMRYLQALFHSRPWHTLVPDEGHVTLLAGYGTFGTSSYATAGRASDGATFIAYLPTARTVIVNMARVSGAQVNAWWFNPATGVSTSLGNFAASGQRAFTPPTSSDPAADWVLVLDDRSRNFGQPGAAPLPQAVPALGRSGWLWGCGLVMALLGWRAREKLTHTSRRGRPSS